MISENSKIFKNVKLGKNVIIEDYCIIGTPPKGFQDGDLETIIGDNSTIRSHTVIYAGNTIGSNFQTGNKANIREKNTIGNNVSVGTLSVIEHHVIIEDDVRIHTQVFIPEYSILKNRCWIGPNVVFTNARYPKSPDVKNDLKGPTIGESAIIGANSTILPAINVGKNAIVGAGSVVTKDISAQKVAWGNPAVERKSKANLPY